MDTHCCNYGGLGSVFQIFYFSQHQKKKHWRGGSPEVTKPSLCNHSNQATIERYQCLCPPRLGNRGEKESLFPSNRNLIQLSQPPLTWAPARLLRECHGSLLLSFVTGTNRDKGGRRNRGGFFPWPEEDKTSHKYFWCMEVFIFSWKILLLFSLKSTSEVHYLVLWQWPTSLS